jgi:hypothetical protein
MPTMQHQEEMSLAWIAIWYILKTGNIRGQRENKRVRSSLSKPWRPIQTAEVQLQSFLASAIEGGQWSPARPLSAGKEFRYPLNTRMGGSHRRSGQFWRRKNILSLPKFQPRTLQPRDGRYNRLRNPGSPEHEIMGRYWKPRHTKTGDTKESHSKT